VNDPNEQAKPEPVSEGPDPREQAPGWPPYEVPADAQSRYKDNVASDGEPQPLPRLESDSLTMMIDPIALDSWDVLAKRERCSNPLCRGCQVDLLLLQAVVALSVQPDYSKMTMEQIYAHLVNLSFVDENGNSRGYIPPPGYDGVAEVRKRLRGGSGPHDPPGRERTHQSKSRSAIIDALKGLFGDKVVVEEIPIPESMGTGRGGEGEPADPTHESPGGREWGETKGHRRYTTGRRGDKPERSARPGFVSAMFSRPPGMEVAQAAKMYDAVTAGSVDPGRIVDMAVEALALIRLAVATVVEGGQPSEDLWASVSFLCDAGEDMEAALNRMYRD
jgi:hypothetical protein